MEELTNAELKQFIAECQLGYRTASDMFEFETAKMYKERIREYRAELDRRKKTAV